MATTPSKEKRRGLTEIVLLIFAVVCLALIIADISINVVSEANATARTAVMMQDNSEATAVPTLTEEQYRDMLGIEGSGSR